MSYSNFNTFKLFENVGINSSSDYMLSMRPNDNNISFHSSNSIDYNNVDIMSIKNIINKKQNEDLNLSSLTGTTINPVITINNNHSDCRIMTDLNVAGNLNIGTSTQFYSIGTTHHYLSDPSAPGGNKYKLYWKGDSTHTILNCGANNGTTALATGGTEIVTVKGSNVGINTTDPALTLDVNGNLRVDYYIYTPTDKDLYIKPGSNFHVQNTTSTNMLTVNGSTGNVGINNTSPSYKLDVNGTARIGSSLKVDGSIESNKLISAPNGESYGLKIVTANVAGSWSGIAWYDTVAHAENTNSTGRKGYIELNTSGNHMLFYMDGATSGSGIVDIYHPLRVTGTVTANGSVLTSDDRLKINEELIQNATNTLLKLRPQIYDKKEELDSTKTKKESGLIVQEIYYEAPELRYLINIPDDATLIDDNKYKNFEDIRNDPDYSNWGTSPAHLNYTGLISYLIQGFKEQQTHITELESLKTENTELKTKINELTSIIDKLKTANSFEEFKQTL